MFKKFASLIIITVLLSYPIPAITQEYEDDEEIINEGYPKSVFGGIGYGGNGVGALLGFRYYRIGISMGVAGVTSSIPSYAHQLPTDKSYEERSYSAYAVCGDFYFFHEIEQFTIYGNLGYFSQADTVLAYYPQSNSNYLLGSKTRDGVTFGAGILFDINDYLLLGVGLHNKYGIYANVAYRWW